MLALRLLVKRSVGQGVCEVEGIGGHWRKCLNNSLSLFVVSGKALNHCTNYRRNGEFPQIPETQCPVSRCCAHSDRLPGCCRERPESAGLDFPWEAAALRYS